MKIIKNNEKIKPNFLIYGPAGCGKSYSISTFTGGPIHILQTEPGRISALDNNQFYAGVQSGLHSVIKIEKAEDLEQIRRGGQNAYQAFCKSMGLEMPAMIALDSISWYNTLVLDSVLRQFPTPRGVPEISHWLMVTEQTRQLIHQLLAADAILCIIAQADIRDMEEPGITTSMWLPGVVGKYATKIAHAVDAVFFAKPSNTTGEVFLHGTGKATFLAKTRGFQCEKPIQLNLDSIVSLWENSMVKEDAL